MFVVHGHYIFGDHTVDPCAVMPPTRYSSVELPKDFFRDYRFDLLCKVKGKVLDLNFGIAVYDVDFDDYANECSSLNKFGSHSRLRTLRKIVDYYKSLSSDRFDEASCTSIVG
ncbi:hypothetical protein V5799_003110 [Amblyomma americanum]|uniref:Uncharacterized protein n=1 Tax=Amblyomma americanum TaxID=6943 RepID=A0AAQ4D9X6_AMBAM